MIRLFLCHSSKDKDFVRRLAADLQTHGLEVWLDAWAMHVGDSLRRKIEQGIDSSTYLAVVLSPDSVQSPWVQAELDAALVKELAARSVFILPLLYRTCEIPLFLRDKVYADFRHSYADGLATLLRRCRLTNQPDSYHGAAGLSSITKSTALPVHDKPATSGLSIRSVVYRIRPGPASGIYAWLAGLATVTAVILGIGIWGHYSVVPTPYLDSPSAQSPFGPPSVPAGNTDDSSRNLIIVRPVSSGARVYTAPLFNSPVLRVISEDEYLIVDQAQATDWLEAEFFSSRLAEYYEPSDGVSALPVYVRRDELELARDYTEAWTSGALVKPRTRLIMRDSPSLQSPVAGILPAGMTVRIESSHFTYSDGYYWIRLENDTGQTGYAVCTYLVPLLARNVLLSTPSS